MIDCSGISRRCGLAASAICVTLIIGACSAATTQATHEDALVAPGIPYRPDLVTVVPFYWKPNETDREKTKVIIPAQVNDAYGIFVLDLGSTPTVMNRTFLQPNATGGVDSVTEANRIADNTPRSNYINGALEEFDHARVRVRIGTLSVPFQDSALSRVLEASNPDQYNIILGHLWGNFGWVFSPRLGNIGPAVLEPYETIIDYNKRRVVLIRLDSAGNRMVDVPAYTRSWTTPMIPVPIIKGISGWGIKVNGVNMLDTVNTVNNTNVRIIDTGAPGSAGRILGYDFLSNLGVFGVNQRTREFILYRPLK
jgi:hypothetical protein